MLVNHAFQPNATSVIAEDVRAPRDQPIAPRAERMRKGNPNPVHRRVCPDQKRQPRP
ncbi:hypothetical protein D805_0079 [Bifidobacterium thermophilum RBL67]|uniref:Uncharacterized protein n=1 Tax=Bifidobacterium thermophilum RBL67 TaxID=1254439 RepID=M4RA44_9BIFI|nr:hypothetical protein D805_0079 [Bifidobacterium thermophilum RBL67]